MSIRTPGFSVTDFNKRKTISADSSRDLFEGHPIFSLINHFRARAPISIILDILFISIKTTTLGLE